MKYDINKIYKMINWDNSPEIQLQGIQLAEQIEDISYFIQPKEGKEIWENCAKILSSKCDDILEPYLVPLIEWLQDINWPGALLIYDRLTRLSANKLLKPFIKCFDKAFANEANEWLDCLAGFINNIEFYEILPDKYRKTLTKHYNNFGKQMKSNKTLSMYENKTIINYENKEKVESIDFHDSNFNSFKYDYILKQINIILRNEFINKNYELLFENVIYCELIGIELWGHSDYRIIDWELVTDEIKINELLYIEGTEKNKYPYSLFKRKPENKYVSTLFTFSSGDTVNIICGKINVNAIK